MRTLEENRAYQNSWYNTPNGKKKRFEANKKWTAKKRAEFKEIKKGLKCNRCPENHVACLEFHHLDPSEKEGDISSMVRSASTKRILEEITKCEVLCANCHRKEHYKDD